MENFTPIGLLNKEMYALGPLEVGRVSWLVQSLQISHFISYTWSCFILRSASLIGERLRQSQASQHYKVTSRERVSLPGALP